MQGVGGGGVPSKPEGEGGPWPRAGPWLLILLLPPPLLLPLPGGDGDGGSLGAVGTLQHHADLPAETEGSPPQNDDVVFQRNGCVGVDAADGVSDDDDDGGGDGCGRDGADAGE